MVAWHAPGHAQARPPSPAPVRFGILPIGGAVESRENWVPLLAAMGKAIKQPVTVRSVASYETLQQAIQNSDVDLALLPGKLALDAVKQQHMNVIAQVMRNRDTATHRAVLLTRKAAPFNTLEGLLAEPERWRLARGDSRSMTGFILPQIELFLPKGIVMETRFRGELVDNHQGTALAVANGDADVATNNTTDFERFKRQFPAEADRLQVVWQSEPTPPIQILTRRELPSELKKELQTFLMGYGRNANASGDAEREVLKSLDAVHGYVAADNTALLPVARLQYQLEKQRALGAQWVNAAAREARLQRIEKSYAQTVELLREGAP